MSSSVADFNARRAAIEEAARLDAGIDAEISADHGLELDGELASEILGGSNAYLEIQDPELRIAYQVAYLEAFTLGV